MASDPALLKAAFTTAIATISDSLRSAEATYTLDRWADAVDKQAALEANDIISYSVGGRTVTRRNSDAGQELIQQLRYDLEVMIYGSVSLLDNNTSGVTNSE